MEERDHETTDPGVQITAAPKARGSMKVLVIVLAALVLLVGAGFLAFSLLRSGPQVRYISGEALAVAKIDLPKMLLKAGIDKDIKNSNKELWELLREWDMEALVEDPSPRGCSLPSQPTPLWIMSRRMKTRASVWWCPSPAVRNLQNS